eukprot:gnl/Chilomastix_cuspidata/1403.p1 GENE.gnl/Chilomastix_cuspidata/1403~~gnl/Chilomastix_cuspidata/1403.p1  ORF type:complete len:426 (-),score=188.71 gnl/Chilomastix_cuspidata/1403:3-1280(-)
MPHTGAGLSRGLNFAEAGFLPANAPIGFLLSIEGPRISEEELSSALDVCRKAFPMLRAALDQGGARFVPSPLPHIPIVQETLPLPGGADVLRSLIRRRIEEPLDRAQTLARAHLIRDPGAAESHLFLIGDHIGLDGRAFFSWVATLLAALAGGAGAARPGPAELVDFSTRLPSLADMPPYDTPPGATVPLTPGDATTLIGSVTELLAPEAFRRLKEQCRAQRTTVFGALAAAWNWAVADHIHAHSGAEPPADGVRVVGAYAADLRAHVVPPIPADTLANASASFNLAVTTRPGARFWESARDLKARAMSAIAANEPLRIKKRMDEGGDIMELFRIAFILSNIGHFPAPPVAGPYRLRAMETHISGPAVAPILSLHALEVSDNLALTLSHAPQFHSRETAAALLRRTFAHLAAAAAEPHRAYAPPK